MCGEVWRVVIRVVALSFSRTRGSARGTNASLRNFLTARLPGTPAASGEVEVALVAGKQKADKRESIRRREDKRDMQRITKRAGY